MFFFNSVNRRFFVLKIVYVYHVSDTFLKKMPLNTFKHKIDYLMLRTFLQIIDFLHIVNNDVYSSFKCLEKHFSGWLHATFISISKTPQFFNNALLKSLSHQVSFGVSDFPILDRRALPIYQNIFFFPDINKLHQPTKKVGHHS